MGNASLDEGKAGDPQIYKQKIKQRNSCCKSLDRTHAVFKSLDIYRGQGCFPWPLRDD